MSNSRLEPSKEEILAVVLGERERRNKGQQEHYEKMLAEGHQIHARVIPEDTAVPMAPNDVAERLILAAGLDQPHSDYYQTFQQALNKHVSTSRVKRLLEELVAEGKLAAMDARTRGRTARSYADPRAVELQREKELAESAAKAQSEEQRALDVAALRRFLDNGLLSAFGTVEFDAIKRLLPSLEA